MRSLQVSLPHDSVGSCFLHWIDAERKKGTATPDTPTFCRLTKIGTAFIREATECAKAGSEPVKVRSDSRLRFSLLDPVKYSHRRPMRCDHVYMSVYSNMSPTGPE